MGIEQFLLSGNIQLGQHDLPAVTQQLFIIHAFNDISKLKAVASHEGIAIFSRRG